MTMLLDLDAELAKGVEDIINPSEEARTAAIPGLDLGHGAAARPIRKWPRACAGP